MYEQNDELQSDLFKAKTKINYLENFKITQDNPSDSYKKQCMEASNKFMADMNNNESKTIHDNRELRNTVQQQLVKENGVKDVIVLYLITNLKDYLANIKTGNQIDIDIIEENITNAENILNAKEKDRDMFD